MTKFDRPSLPRNVAEQRELVQVVADSMAKLFPSLKARLALVIVALAVLGVGGWAMSGIDAWFVPGIDTRPQVLFYSHRGLTGDNPHLSQSSTVDQSMISKPGHGSSSN